jgi:hypothetical protein
MNAEADIPLVSDHPETDALWSEMNGRETDVWRICTNMTKKERLSFQARLLKIKHVLEQLAAVRCKHCHKIIKRTVKYGQVHWWHDHNGIAQCIAGEETHAEPAPQED